MTAFILVLAFVLAVPTVALFKPAALPRMLLSATLVLIMCIGLALLLLCMVADDGFGIRVMLDLVFLLWLPLVGLVAMIRGRLRREAEMEQRGYFQLPAESPPGGGRGAAPRIEPHF